MAENKKTTASENVAKTFKDIAAINVNDHVDKKKSGNKELSYLSWAWAVSKASEIDPDWEYKILEFDVNGMPVERGLPYQKLDGGYFVQTEVTFLGKVKKMWLPVMDHRNNAVKDHPYQIQRSWGTDVVQPIDANLINKTVMRCLVKNLAMFGLGLYIYAGEDLPEDEDVTVIDNSTGEVIETVSVDNVPVAPVVNEPAVQVVAENVPEPQVTMTFEEAMVHMFEHDLGSFKLKGKPILGLIAEAKTEAEKQSNLNILNCFAQKGPGKDKAAAALILEAVENGVVKFTGITENISEEAFN